MTHRLGLPLEKITLGPIVGQGVSGQVFEATLRNGLRVAVKVYTMDAVDPAFRPRERFRRECRLLSRLSHPAFPALLGCGETADGTSYAIMEWIDGRPLSDFRMCAVPEALRLAHGIASGLAALHGLGAIHRDVAFDNVLVEQRRFGSHPRLIDLGVAKELDAEVELTAAGNFLGRIPFASPELLTELGAAGVRDPKSDVFSLGVLLFEWFTSTRPFAGELPADIKKAQRRNSLPPFLVDSGRGRLDPSVERFVRRLLCLDPAGRPTSIEMVHGLLELRRLHPSAPFSSSGRALLIDEEDGQFVVRTRLFPARLRAKSLHDVDWSQETAGGAGVSLGGVADEWATQAGVRIPRDADVPPPAPETMNVLGALSADPRVSRWVLWLGITAFVLTSVAALALLLRS